MADTQIDPGAEYARRLASRSALERGLERRERHLSNLRLALFTLGVVVTVAVWRSENLGRLWLVPPLLVLGAFAAAVLLHDATRTRRRVAARAVAFYERGLERLAHRFAGRGRTGERFCEPDHPYASHLDLFGEGSLFELLSTAQTAAGEETLAHWLLERAAPAEIRRRQEAVEELRVRLDLREDLATLGPDVRGGLDPRALAAWGRAPATTTLRRRRLLAIALVAASAAAAGLWAAGAGPLPLLAALGVQGGFALAWRVRVRAVLGEVDRAARNLALLGTLLARLEQERFTSEKAIELRRALDTEGSPPSARIARLRRWIELLDSRRNQLFAPLAPLLLWTTQCAFAIEAWRAECGARLPIWLAAVGEIEALLDLAGYAYERPVDPFPELVEGEACFEGVALGHPLIPATRCVANDLRLGAERRLLVVSGSNMSGKSTLLRTVGVNAVLAQAGGPVCAVRLRLSPLAVGATLRIVDSIQDGRSRFFAEITALRGIVALTEASAPVLFLLDELLHGTNSHDRRLGAAAVVRGLLARRAIGVVTTHDLALAEIAETLGTEAANVHFEDRLEDGELRFDYRLRPGVASRSNALELMRTVGLEV